MIIELQTAKKSLHRMNGRAIALQLQVCRIQKFNMKCETERMEIIYTFYFFAFLKKVIKNY